MRDGSQEKPWPWTTGSKDRRRRVAVGGVRK
jgi:hypothetical protein